MENRDMQILTAIKELIFEQGTVALPGLGRFIGQYQSAVIDSLQGQVLPPALVLRFDTTDLMNDGVLQQFLQQKYQLSALAAQGNIEAFVMHIKAVFDQNELFMIPEVGRLYRDTAKNIQFYPDNTNFNTDSFGLPTVAFYPISRPQTAEIPPAPVVTLEAEPLRTPELPQPMVVSQAPVPAATRWPILPDVRHKSVWLTLSLAALVVVALCFNYLGGQNGSETAQKSMAQAPPPLINTPPLHKEPTDSVPYVATEDYVGRRTDRTPETEARLVPKSDKAIILIGGFKDEANIKRLNKWTLAQGYEVYEKKVGAITRVGSIVSYGSKAELRQILAKFRSKYGSEVALVKS